MAAKNDSQWVDASADPRVLAPKEVLVGRYLGKTEIELPDRVAIVHTFRMEDGTADALWGSTLLDQALRAVPMERLTRIECTGERKAGNGRSMHAYKVQISKRDDAAPF